MAIEQCPLNSSGARDDLELLWKIGLAVYSSHDESKVKVEGGVPGKIDQLACNLNSGKIFPANRAHMQSVPYVAQVYVSLVSGCLGDFAWESLPENYVPVAVIDDILNSSAEIVYSKARLNWLIRGRRNITHVFLVEWSELRVRINDSYQHLVIRSGDLKLKK